MSCGEELARALRARNFRVTPQRAVILETVAHMDGHPSVREVYQRCRPRLLGLNVATVYRTIETLSRAGLVDLFTTPFGEARFALHDPANPHGHLVCRVCNTVLEFDPQSFSDQAEELEAQHGFAADLNHLTLTGVCARCAAADGRRPTRARG